ncbi:MAG: transcriptional regulator LysR family [Rhodospirillales bacterium]|nr:transcriptional regulator LysR family [Rhodospirillales bacterium]
MLDGLSLDQLRTFIAAAEEGSFSAAGRRLGRAQSVVSHTIANLEDQLEVLLFDRSGRYPRLTDQGRILLGDARAVAGGIDSLKARAKSMAGGVEHELSVVMDVMFPMAVVTKLAGSFSQAFPATPLRLYVEALGGVAKALLDGRCDLGVMGTLAVDVSELVSERLVGVRMIMVASPDHPLARHPGLIGQCELSKHVQLVLTDRTELSAGQEFGVFSPRTWRLADLGAKHAFLRAGLGWGGMPATMVERDLAEGALVEIALEDAPAEGMTLAMSAAYRADAPPGPAGRWFVDQMKILTSQCPGGHDAATAKVVRPIRRAAG